MKKTHYRDYTTEMFRQYAIHKNYNTQPTDPALLADINAIHSLITEYVNNKCVVELQAIEAVYLTEPQHLYRKNIISSRVCAFSIGAYLDQRQVYKLLAEARKKAAIKRGLLV